MVATESWRSIFSLSLNRSVIWAEKHERERERERERETASLFPPSTAPRSRNRLVDVIETYTLNKGGDLSEQSGITIQLSYTHGAKRDYSLRCLQWLDSASCFSFLLHHRSSRGGSPPFVSFCGCLSALQLLPVISPQRKVSFQCFLPRVGI